MRLGYIRVYVPDVPAALDFCERAFGFEQRFLTRATPMARWKPAALRSAFAAESLIALNGVTARPNRRSDPPAAAEVGLVTDDVAAAYRKAVSAGAVAYQEPAEKPWGQTVGYVRDDNGFLVEICSPMGA